ncbi:MAG: enoyl-CoA hydratase/isomerase family protein [Myxococcota bacterium]
MYTITLDGPAKNALGSDMMQAILDQLEEADGQAILLTGAGDALSAGLNLNEIVSLDEAGMRTFLKLFESMVQALLFYPGPTCALVNGHAIAGGAIVTLCCDLSVSAPNPKARIGLNEVALGLRFPPRLLKAIAHRLPPHHREEVLLGSALHSPQRAAELGLLTAVAEDPQAWIETHFVPRTRYDLEAYAAAKQALRQGAMTISETEMAQYEAIIVPAWTSPELKATIRSLLGR